jgi:2-hydroxyacyl-CoA lyase 1
MPGPAAHGRAQEYIEEPLNLLEKAERPLVLVGKGMAWSRAEDEVRTLSSARKSRSCGRRWARA